MYKIFSVDDHIIEPADVWSSRVSAKYRDVAPHVVEENGREFWVYEHQRLLTMGLNAVAGKPRDQWDVEPARFSDMIPGCYDPKARSQDMLSQGVLASVNFPTLPRFGGMLFKDFKDKALANECVTAWNDFILDEWCPGGPEGMFVPMVICQLWDPPAAAAEIRRCVDKGAHALCFIDNPAAEDMPSFHGEYWDPIWRAAEETDIPVCMHIGAGGSPIKLDPGAPMTMSITLGNVHGMISMVNLLVSPVCHKFPDIKLVFSEAGIGWIPAILERTDRQVDRHYRHAGRAGELKPSELFARNMYACMVEEPIGLGLYELIGVDRIVSESDYPHADTPFPHMQKAYAEMFDELPDDVIEAVSYGNAERIFRWKMADESLCESPDVQRWRATLEQDPFAAMQLRHSIGGIDHGHVESSGPNCGEMIIRAAAFVECGLPLTDGRCAAGHGVS